ncbi:MAG: hypothetical protein MZU97_01450 [Bacillus subtilis]|nr:hypothetical protein [Bacillus subtilis]
MFADGANPNWCSTSSRSTTPSRSLTAVLTFRSGVLACDPSITIIANVGVRRRCFVCVAQPHVRKRTHHVRQAGGVPLPNAKKVLVFGAAGSGSSTIAKAIAHLYGHHWIEVDEALFMPTDPPFSVRRSLDEVAPDRLRLVVERRIGRRLRLDRRLGRRTEARFRSRHFRPRRRRGPHRVGSCTAKPSASAPASSKAATCIASISRSSIGSAPTRAAAPTSAVLRSIAIGSRTSRRRSSRLSEDHPDGRDHDAIAAIFGRSGRPNVRIVI